MAKVFLSPSALSVFRSCERCFWLTKNKKIKRPEGIKASLPTGMDGVIKTYFDTMRKEGKVPTGMKGKLFQDQKQLDYWRNWQNWAKTDLSYETDRGRMAGFLDDLFVEEDGSFSPFDYKTRGTATKGSFEDYGKKYYQSQMDIYTLLLKSKGMKPSGFAYLNFFYPTAMVDEKIFAFTSYVAKIETNPDNAVKLFESALDSLSLNVAPEAALDCEYCKLVEAQKTQQ